MTVVHIFSRSLDEWYRAPSRIQVFWLNIGDLFSNEQYTGSMVEPLWTKDLIKNHYPTSLSLQPAIHFNNHIKCISAIINKYSANMDLTDYHEQIAYC